MKKEENKKGLSLTKTKDDKNGTVTKKVSNEKKVIKTETEKSQVSPKKEAVNEFVIRARFLRISPRKMRLVTNLIKGMSIEEAQVQLTFNPKRASVFLLKMLVNAEKTAVHNYKLEKENLYIKNILVNQGPTLHRFKPAARGAAHPIRKRSSHLEIIVAKRTEGLSLTKSRDKKSQLKTMKVLKKTNPESKSDQVGSKNLKKEKN